jgi:hypothetical protein
VGETIKWVEVSDSMGFKELKHFQWDSASAIPEPSTWAMMLVGFAGLGFAGYRKTNGKAAFAASSIGRQLWRDPREAVSLFALVSIRRLSQNAPPRKFPVYRDLRGLNSLLGRMNSLFRTHREFSRNYLPL